MSRCAADPLRGAAMQSLFRSSESAQHPLTKAAFQYRRVQGQKPLAFSCCKNWNDLFGESWPAAPAGGGGGGLHGRFLLRALLYRAWVAARLLADIQWDKAEEVS